MSGTKIWGIGERHLWRQHVTDGLNLITEELTAGTIEAIELGLGRDTLVVGIVIEERAAPLKASVPISTTV